MPVRYCYLCENKEEPLIHLAPGVYACFQCDMVGRFPIYIEVKGPQ